MHVRLDLESHGGSAKKCESLSRYLTISQRQRFFNTYD